MPETYPLPKFSFLVAWGGTKASFTEVKGLVMEQDEIAFRHCDSPDRGKLTMPGLKKHNKITASRGTFANDIEFNTWLEEVTADRVNTRRDVIISLLDETRTTVRAWKAVRCFATKVTASDLKSDVSEVAVESVEFTHEGLLAMAL